MYTFRSFVNFFFRCFTMIFDYFDSYFLIGGFSIVKFYVACLVIDIVLGALVVRFAPSSGDFKPGKPPRKSRGSGGSRSGSTAKGR